MKRIQKIGSNRGKDRIWIEGQCLLSMGWTKGTRFNCEFQQNRIVYTRTEEGKRKVAGTDQRPIIDTNTDKIRQTLGDFDYVHVHIQKNVIVISPAERPASKVKGALAALMIGASMVAPYISQFSLKAKRVLVACEESATVRNEFIKLGHDAVSCDILPTRDPVGGWHIQGDVTPFLDEEWDMVLGFPPCTYLATSAAYAFKDPDYVKYPGVGYHQKVKPDKLMGVDRRLARAEAIAFVDRIYKSCDTVCIENPKGFLSSMWKKPSQMIHPHYFGDPHSKETFLWRKNLPELQPTDMLDIKEHGYLVEKGKHAGKWRWQNQAPCGAFNDSISDDRAKHRSKTYDGVAKAMALQWGGDLS